MHENVWGHGCEELAFTACPVAVTWNLQASDKAGASPELQLTIGPRASDFSSLYLGLFLYTMGTKAQSIGCWKGLWVRGRLPGSREFWIVTAQEWILTIILRKLRGDTPVHLSHSDTLTHIHSDTPTHIHSDIPTHVYLLMSLVNSVPAPTHTLKCILTHILSYSFTCNCSHSPTLIFTHSDWTPLTLTLTQVCILTHHDDKCSSIPISLTGSHFC